LTNPVNDARKSIQVDKLQAVVGAALSSFATSETFLLMINFLRLIRHQSIYLRDKNHGVRENDTAAMASALNYFS
jgi:hypothetical protein